MTEKQPRNVGEYERPTRKTRTWPAAIAMLVFVILLIFVIRLFF